MTTALTQRLDALGTERLRGMRRGVEKESLRCDADGRLAASPHPAALGSALTHPSITTDFSESQLELITAAHTSVAATVEELRQVHQFVVRAIGDERLWVSSMPCRLPADDAIPLGRYGTSNLGRAKTVYRAGLSHRYGRRMQTICGIHYNWSLPGLGNDEYLALIRNVRRHAFLLLWLFGASPLVCKCFVEGRRHELEPVGADSFGLPHATSLRMGRLGYQSDAQASIAVSYNDLEGYCRSLERALTTPYPPYEAIGVRGADGAWRQLAPTLLQIENEFYATIRPKRRIRSGERPLHALRERGIEYVEVRCIDLDPFEPLGIGAATMHLLDVFLLHCLLAPSAPDSPAEHEALARNQQRTAAHGRQPGLRLERDGREVTLVEWAAEILEQFRPIARALDAAHGGSAHDEALRGALALLDRPRQTPSARVLEAAQREHDGSFHALGCALGERARDAVLAMPVDTEAQRRLQRLAEASVREQREREAADTLPFEAYLEGYLALASLRV
jgi:glutamate--cysteine ligase